MAFYLELLKQARTTSLHKYYIRVFTFTNLILRFVSLTGFLIISNLVFNFQIMDDIEFKEEIILDVAHKYDRYYNNNFIEIFL